MPDTVKSLLKNFALFAILCLYFVGLIYLMSGIFDPIDPVYSFLRIAAWIGYLCIGGAVWATARTRR